jgi:hypothetical protein
MTHTYTPGTDIARVRREIPTEKVSTTSILSDEEIQSYIDDQGGWMLAAAEVLDFFANNCTLVLQQMSDSGYSISGATMASDLRGRAAELRKQYNSGGSTDEELAGFDFAVTERESWI